MQSTPLPETVKHQPYIVDQRTRCIGVYRGPRVECFEHLAGDSDAFILTGTGDGYEPTSSDRALAERLAAVLNRMQAEIETLRQAEVGRANGPPRMPSHCCNAPVRFGLDGQNFYCSECCSGQGNAYFFANRHTIERPNWLSSSRDAAESQS